MNTAQGQEKLIRKRIGEIPLLQAIERRLGFRSILRNYIKHHGNNTVPVVDTLMLLVFNIALCRQPLYELRSWAGTLDKGLLCIDSEDFEEALSFTSIEKIFNDDRCGRSLDTLYGIDRACASTDISINVMRAISLTVDQLHNDSTSVKSFGKMPGTTETGLSFKHGVSKDHRHDLKQIVYNLTISADGAVPVHFQTYPGNTTDDTLHINTWDMLCKIAGKTDFLYVADSTKSRRFRRSVPR